MARKKEETSEKKVPLNKFIGSMQIQDFAVSGDHTPRGSDILKVTYVDGSVEFLPSPMFDYIVREAPIDDSDLRNLRVLAIAKEVIEVFAEYDIKLNEIEQLQQVIKSTQDENYIRAQTVLWKTPEKRWLDIYRVLRDAGVGMIGSEEAVEK